MIIYGFFFLKDMYIVWYNYVHDCSCNVCVYVSRVWIVSQPIDIVAFVIAMFPSSTKSKTNTQLI